MHQLSISHHNVNVQAASQHIAVDDYFDIVYRPVQLVRVGRFVEPALGVGSNQCSIGLVDNTDI